MRGNAERIDGISGNDPQVDASEDLLRRTDNMHDQDGLKARDFVEIRHPELITSCDGNCAVHDLQLSQFRPDDMILLSEPVEIFR